MKIIFDQSAFHNQLDLLKGSRLLQLTQNGKITVYHTATFLDETLRMADSARPGRKDALKRQWSFLKSTCNGGWFRPLLLGPPNLKSVCDEELGEGPQDLDWPLVPSSCRSDVEAKVTRFLEDSGSFPELISSRPIYDVIEQVKKKNIATRFKLRNEQRLPKDITFRQYHQAHFFDAGRLLIHRLRYPDQLQIPVAIFDQPDAKYDAWKCDWTRFPHFTAFVGFWIYSFYDAETHQNSPLDRNWQGDAEQLCFLVDVDSIVSSDMGFMKQAFEALWQPSEKRFFTPNEFLDFLSLF
jgi:hypothetical protein